jgi:hypothetical protein
LGSPWIAGKAEHATIFAFVAVVLVLREKLADFHLDEVEHLRVLHRVALVERDHDVTEADLASEEHVLARLRHDRVERRHDEDRAVHLRGARDHVLDVVGVAGAVDVRVVALLRLVLHVRSRDRDGLRRVTDGAALGDVRVRNRPSPVLLRLNLGRARP